MVSNKNLQVLHNNQHVHPPPYQVLRNIACADGVGMTVENIGSAKQLSPLDDCQKTNINFLCYQHVMIINMVGSTYSNVIGHPNLELEVPQRGRIILCMCCFACWHNLALRNQVSSWYYNIGNYFCFLFYLFYCWYFSFDQQT